MYHPEIDLNQVVPIKALRIYEEFKASGRKYLMEKTLVKLVQNGEFASANEYYDCLCLFYALGMVSETDGEIRFNSYETN